MSSTFAHARLRGASLQPRHLFQARPVAVALIALIASLTAPAGATELTAQQEGVFQLGTVEVSAQRAIDGNQVASTLSQEKITQDQNDTVGSAVAVLPGVSRSRNTRNEDTVFLRGFDSRQVPMFVDGVPLYVPYDGYVDFARFTTFDLSEIRVAKSGASLLYGPNTLGGAINLVTRKPARAFEGDMRLGVGSGSEKMGAFNLGTQQGTWYAQLGVSYLDADGFPLPRGFKDYKAKPSDTGSHRENAYRTDQRLSFKIGLTPNATDEYALGYVRQDGEKGNPVYTGESTKGIRYWQWPYWDKDSLYLISRTRIGQNNVLKARVFHDTYKNSIIAFTDGSYARQLNNASFPSVYNDSSTGASLELANYAFENHELRLALHLKEDQHEDVSNSAPNKYYRDMTTSLAVEDSITLAPDWRLRAGLSHDKRDAKAVYEWPTGSTSATNGLVELSHLLDHSGSEAYAIASHKTRFPTIKDRYSARLGTALPNPNLKPESANHLEVGIKGSPWAGGKGQAAVFYSRINNLMQNVYVDAPMGTCGAGNDTCAQAQNVGRTRSAGLELSLDQAIGRRWSVAGAYTYLARRNLSDSSVQLTDTPRHRLYAGVTWAPSDRWELRTTWETEQGRKVAFAGSGKTVYRDLAGFGILGVKATWKPRKDTALDFGVANLGDKWYEFSEGLPMPGRTWFVRGSYRF